MIAEALVAAALASGPVALMDAPRGQDVALAGNEIVLARAGQHGDVIVNAVAVEGGAVRRLLKVRHPRGRGWTAQAAVSASPQRVALGVFYEQFRERRPNRYQWRLYTGPASGPLRLMTNSRGTGWVPVHLDVDGDRLLVTEMSIERLRTRLRLFAPPAAPRVLPIVGEASEAALTGDHVAHTNLNRGLFVTNLDSGARETEILQLPDSTFGLDVAADGRVVLDSEDGLLTVAPGQAPTRLGGGDLGRPRFAGASIAAVGPAPVDAERALIFDPGAAAPRVLGVPTNDLTALDADERGVAWLGNGCVLYAPAAGAPPAEPPAGPCPRSEAFFEEHDQVLRGRELRFDVACVAAPVATGCTGRIVVRLRGFAGSGRFHVPAGTEGIATVRLTRRAARLMRRQVRREGDAALLLRGHVDDGRPPERNRLFVVDNIRDRMSRADSRGRTPRGGNY